MKTWRFTFKCEYFGAEFELPFSVDADTYHDATILADAHIKEKFPIACEQDLATIKFEGLGMNPKDWGKSKRELPEPCEICATKYNQHDFCPHHNKLVHQLKLTDEKQIKAQFRQKTKWLFESEEG